MPPRWFQGVKPNQVLPQQWLFMKTCPECHRFQTSVFVFVSPHKRKRRSRAVNASERLNFVICYFTCQYQRGEEQTLNHFVSLDGLQKQFENYTMDINICLRRFRNGDYFYTSKAPVNLSQIATFFCPINIEHGIWTVLSLHSNTN